MNPQNSIAEIAAKALAKLTDALEAGDSEALTADLNITANSITTPGRIAV